MKKFALLITILIVSPTLLAQQKSALQQSFHEINDSLFGIYAIRDYCNKHFHDFIERNNEAYDEWELQYNFFLKDFDTHYLSWKKGFNELEKQQLAALEAIQRYEASQKIANDYEEGARDKCYTFKPALSRPRNNLELTHQDAINLIRMEARSNFGQTRGFFGAKPECTWQHQQALDVIEKRNQGIDEKTQEKEFKAFRKMDTDLDKSSQKQREDAYDDMIKEVYDYPQLPTKTFGLYRFIQCELENRDIDIERLKKTHEQLTQCQQTSADDNNLLARCISEEIIEK